MEQHLLILIPVILLIFAAIAAVTSDKIADIVSLFATLFAAIASIYLGHKIFGDSGSLSYAVGGWKVPIGIEYRLDKFNAVFLVLVNVIAFIFVLLLPRFFSEFRTDRNYIFSLVLLFIAGLDGILISNDLFNIFVFLEISSLSIYALIACSKNPRALLASFNYLLVGTIGASLFLFGVGLLYVSTGSLNITDLNVRISTIQNSYLVRASAAFILAGIFIKLGIFPFYSWIVNIYKEAANYLTALICAISGKVILYLLIKIIFSVYGYDYLINKLPAQPILLTLAIGGIFFGAIKAFYQKNLLGIYAYSSLSQTSFILFLIGVASNAALVIAVQYIIVHTLIMFVIFVLISISMQNGQYDGFSKLSKVAFLIANLSLIGFPFTVGFLPKFGILSILAESQDYVLLAVIILSFFITIYYSIKAYSIYGYSAPKNLEEFQIFSLRDLFSIVAIITLLGFGFSFGFLLNISDEAAQSLQGQ